MLEEKHPAERMLRACEVVGLYTYAAFLLRMVACEPFAIADLDTGLIERSHAHRQKQIICVWRLQDL